MLFARGPESGGSADAGASRDRLLDWIQDIESKEGVKITSLYWNEDTEYWLEVGGRRIEHSGPLPPLEFAR
jgi:hypothetical protein